jgi:hypothetical protein
MIVSMFFDAGVDFQLLFNGQEDIVVDISKDKSVIHIEYNPIYSKSYTLTVSCSDPAVRNNPVVVTQIVFDRYWRQQDGKLASGCNYYDQAHIDWAKDNGVELDYTVMDNQILFFTGKLVFTYTHPIYKHIEKTLR